MSYLMYVSSTSITTRAVSTTLALLFRKHDGGVSQRVFQTRRLQCESIASSNIFCCNLIGTLERKKKEIRIINSTFIMVCHTFIKIHSPYNYTTLTVSESPQIQENYLIKRSMNFDEILNRLASNTIYHPHTVAVKSLDLDAFRLPSKSIEETTWAFL